MTVNIPGGAMNEQCEAAEQAAAKKQISQEMDKQLIGGVVGTATKNSLDSNLNYGSGLQAYGWKCINKVENILEIYKTRIGRHAIEKSLSDLKVDERFESESDFKTFCDNLDQVGDSDELIRNIEEKVGVIDDSLKKKIKAKYKKISQEVDGKYHQLRKEIANDFFKRWEIDKLSWRNLSLDAGAAAFGGPLNFLGHFLGTYFKIRSSEAMPEEAQKKFQEFMENWNRENNDPTEISPKNGNSAEKTLTADPSQVNQESGGKIVSPLTVKDRSAINKLSLSELNQ